MKFCYVDESGKGTEPILVLTGIVADAHRMHVTKADWSEILQTLSRRLNKPLEEFHTHLFYRGNDIWRRLNGEQRTAVLDSILQWMTDRNHKIVFSAIDKKKADAFNFDGKGQFMGKDRPNYWKLGALHLLLSVQKFHQSKERNKGHTVMVFDEGSSQEELAELVLKPPTWTDSFYDYERLIRRRKAELPNPELPMNMIVDVPYFADSRHVGMLQLADLFAYLLRHYAELEAGYTAKEYDREAEKVAGWVSQVATLLVPDSFRWKATGGCDCNKFFRAIAPESLVGLHRKPRASQ
jgi:hypothetical protein